MNKRFLFIILIVISMIFVSSVGVTAMESPLAKYTELFGNDVRVYDPYYINSDGSLGGYFLFNIPSNTTLKFEKEISAGIAAWLDGSGYLFFKTYDPYTATFKTEDAGTKVFSLDNVKNKYGIVGGRATLGSGFHKFYSYYKPINDSISNSSFRMGDYAAPENYKVRPIFDFGNGIVIFNEFSGNNLVNNQFTDPHIESFLNPEWVMRHTYNQDFKTIWNNYPYRVKGNTSALEATIIDDVVDYGTSECGGRHRIVYTSKAVDADDRNFWLYNSWVHPVGCLYYPSQSLGSKIIARVNDNVSAAPVIAHFYTQPVSHESVPSNVFYIYDLSKGTIQTKDQNGNAINEVKSGFTYTWHRANAISQNSDGTYTYEPFSEIESIRGQRAPIYVSDQPGGLNGIFALKLIVEADSPFEYYDTDEFTKYGLTMANLSVPSGTASVIGDHDGAGPDTDCNGDVDLQLTCNAVTDVIYQYKVNDGEWIGRFDVPSTSFTHKSVTGGTVISGLNLGENSIYVRFINTSNNTVSPDIEAKYSVALKLDAPNGGESWAIGSTRLITWDNCSLPGTVKIVFLKNGIKLGNIATNVNLSSGFYSWDVGSHNNGMATSGSGYQVKLRTDTGGYIDTSDSEFSLTDGSYAQVTSPNGGENFGLGITPWNISWNNNGLTGNVKIVLLQNGIKLGNIASGVDIATSPYSWTNGEHSNGHVVAGTGYQIKLRTDTGGYIDISDGTFNINGANVTTPNGSESWQLGTTQNITWDYSGVSGTVKIVLLKNGVKLGNIASGVDLSYGSFSWTVGSHSNGTAVAGTDYQIKLRTDSGAYIDISDNFFEITN